MNSTASDEIYYTCQWADPVTITSFTYNNSGLIGIYTMTFSDESRLTFTCETGTQGGSDGAESVVFFKWKELFPNYTQDAYDSAQERINAVTDGWIQITELTICHDTTTGRNDLCDTTLYINTNSNDITTNSADMPYFGFRSTHNGNYGHETNICKTNAAGAVVYNKRILL